MAGIEKENRVEQAKRQERSSDGGPDAELELFKVEFEQLAQGYRHTYQTIWQAGSVFVAISAGLLVFGSSEALGATYTAIVVRFIWPLPFLFWWLGVFTPMDRYGKFRLKRLAELEEYAEGRWHHHRMQHFSKVEGATLPRRQKLIRLQKVRVGYMVDVFGLLILIAWGALLFAPIWADGSQGTGEGRDPSSESRIHYGVDLLEEDPDARIHRRPSD